jgi:hypothetical protein
MSAEEAEKRAQKLSKTPTFGYPLPSLTEQLDDLIDIADS